jgi:hypothetical protein
MVEALNHTDMTLALIHSDDSTLQHVLVLFWTFFIAFPYYTTSSEPVPVPSVATSRTKKPHSWASLWHTISVARRTSHCLKWTPGLTLTVLLGAREIAHSCGHTNPTTRRRERRCYRHPDYGVRDPFSFQYRGAGRRLVKPGHRRGRTTHLAIREPTFKIYYC